MGVLPRNLVVVAAVAIGLRAAVFAGVALLDGATFAEYAAYRDGDQYMAYARAWLGDPSALDARTGRLFRPTPG